MPPSHPPAAAPAPRSILRGHESQVHATAFVRRNQRLATGDAQGYVVLWDLTIRRPRAVWRAHANAILGIAPWAGDCIITHGRDNRLVVWKIGDSDEAALSTSLPLDGDNSPRPAPWIMHILEVNTLNFCSFASCPAVPRGSGSPAELLIAVPNTLASESVDIYHLPSQRRVHTIQFTDSAREKTGMVMALALLWVDGVLSLIAAYENGMVLVGQYSDAKAWSTVYKAQPHTQPVLSLDVSPTHDYFLTSGADAFIVKHPIRVLGPSIPRSTQTPEDEDTKEQKNLGSAQPSPGTGHGSSLLSSALSRESTSASSPVTLPIAVETQPLKLLDTKHSGQQSLRIRSDGKIFATAGWDSKVRVYSAKTMSELAVLKWHNAGCYAAAFADIPGAGTLPQSDHQTTSVLQGSASQGLSESNIELLSQPGNPSVKERRIQLAKETHWLAVGSKDGKISLWDIY